MALVAYVLGDCPGCGAKDSYGNVDVYRTHVYKGCKRCRYHERVRLPPIRKRVIYLDQFFFSHAFRAGDQRFLDAAEKIARLSELQLIVAPYSSIHEDETHQWARRNELEGFIEETSRGKEFRYAFDVLQAQLQKGFRAWLGGQTMQYQLEHVEALGNEIHDWDGYVYIDVGRYMGDIELIRHLKLKSIEGLVALFDGWRQAGPSFEADLQAEFHVAGKSYIDFYLGYMLRIASGDVAAMLDSPEVSMVVQSMLYLVPPEVPEDLRLRKCAEFLMSDHFKELPCEWLNAHILATLKAMVKEGAYANRDDAVRRLKGFFFDVKHIATYAPYVDAFVMDQAMAEFVARPTVALEQRYGVKIFSLNNWNEFFAWLDGIEANGMTEQHRAGLTVAYPRLCV